MIHVHNSENWPLVHPTRKNVCVNNKVVAEMPSVTCHRWLDGLILGRSIFLLSLSLLGKDLGEPEARRVWEYGGQAITDFAWSVMRLCSIDPQDTGEQGWCRT